MTSNNYFIDLTSSPDESNQKIESSRNPVDESSSTKRKLELQEDPPRKHTSYNDGYYIIDSSQVSILNDDKKEGKDSNDTLKELDIDRSKNDEHATLTHLNIPLSMESSTLFCSRRLPVLLCSCCLRMTDSYEDSRMLKLAHIQQHDKWSCGFRNLQMILYNILMKITPDHPLLQKILPTRIPSLKQLQQYMECAWMEGFDPTGRTHFRGKVTGTKSKIGAMEINAITSYLQLDSAVVQFIVCEESKSLLGPFVWEYFQRRNGCRSCPFCRTEPDSSTLLARDLLAWVQNDRDFMNETCCHSVLPLYLQWEGHSVTIIGIEECGDGGHNLIILDPMKNWESIQSDDVHWWKGMCLSTQITMKKDCQIVIFSAKPLLDQEREQRKRNENINVLTAAHNIVQRKVSERMQVKL